MSSETSNGYLNEAEVTWQTFDEEADTQSTQSAHMDVTTDPQSQGSLLLSHNEALAGIGINKNSPESLKKQILAVFIPNVHVFYTEFKEKTRDRVWLISTQRRSNAETIWASSCIFFGFFSLLI